MVLVPLCLLADFEKMMMTLKVRINNPDPAEALADVYRIVNPGNYQALTPVLSLMELKQAAEMQCQSGRVSFDDGEKLFTTWWQQAKRLYSVLPFRRKTDSQTIGFLTEWTVLSAPSGGNCGGAPLRAQLEIMSDGYIGKLSFLPLVKVHPD
jgi:hypothetical protein